MASNKIYTLKWSGIIEDGTPIIEFEVDLDNKESAVEGIVNMIYNLYDYYYKYNNSVKTHTLKCNGRIEDETSFVKEVSFIIELDFDNKVYTISRIMDIVMDLSVLCSKLANLAN